jgi:antitoxin VapB
MKFNGLNRSREWHMLKHMPSDTSSNLPPGVRYVRLFRNGRNQALRIPREFEFDTDEAVLRREGDSLLLTPVRPKSLLSALSRLERLEESFVLVEDPKPEVAES